MIERLKFVKTLICSISLIRFEIGLRLTVNGMNRCLPPFSRITSSSLTWYRYIRPKVEESPNFSQIKLMFDPMNKEKSFWRAFVVGYSWLYNFRLNAKALPEYFMNGQRNKGRVLYAETPNEFIIFLDNHSKVMDRITMQKFLIAYYSSEKEDDNELALFDVGSPEDCNAAFKRIEEKRKTEKYDRSHKRIVCVDFSEKEDKSWIVDSIDVEAKVDENDRKSVVIKLIAPQHGVDLYTVSYTVEDLLAKYTTEHKLQFIKSLVVENGNTRISERDVLSSMFRVLTYSNVQYVLSSGEISFTDYEKVLEDLAKKMELSFFIADPTIRNIISKQGDAIVEKTLSGMFIGERYKASLPSYIIDTSKYSKWSSEINGSGQRGIQANPL
jgi:hypothetical protein